MVGRSRVRVLLVFMLFVLSAVAYLDRVNISVAGVQMRAEYGIDQVRLGWVFSAFLVGYALFQVPAGWLATRLGPRRVLTLAILWWALFTALTALVSPAWGNIVTLLIVVRAALGAGESVVYPAGNQFLARWIPAEERGKANGWIFAGVGAGSGIAPPLVTWIVATGGWRASFYICALIGLVIGGCWYLLARDAPEEHPGVDSAELAHIRSGLPTAPVGDRAPTPWKTILTSRNVWALFASYFAFGYVVWLFFSWFFIYLAEARDLDLKSSALYAMLPFIAMTLCCLAGGVVNDRLAATKGLYWGRCLLSVASFLLTGAFLFAGPAVTSTGIAVAILTGGAGAIYLSQSGFWSVTADIAGEHTGVVSGFMNMGCQIGGAITASLTPWIAERFGWAAAFDLAAALTVIGAAIWAFVDPTRPLEPVAAAGAPDSAGTVLAIEG
jgi:ACS family glucarate transporter-like MFS transporter